MKLIVNAQTKEKTIVPLTQEENDKIISYSKSPAFLREKELIAKMEAKKEELSNNDLIKLTLEQVDSWVESEVINIASIKVVLKKIIKLILARS